MRRALRPLAALAMLAVIVAGCGKGSADTGSNSTDAGHNNTRTKAVKFAECMRQNGVSDFPDPDALGELTIDAVANGSSVDTSSAVFGQALRACQDLEPAGFTGYERTAQQQEAALRFAQCIREHGVKDFPDPGPNDPLVDTRRIPSANRPGGMTILNAAMQQCDASAAGVEGP
jgi:hypothetical protein